jgi:hypothetical protein
MVIPAISQIKLYQRIWWILASIILFLKKNKQKKKKGENFNFYLKINKKKYSNNHIITNLQSITCLDIFLILFNLILLNFNKFIIFLFYF